MPFDFSDALRRATVALTVAAIAARSLAPTLLDAQAPARGSIRGRVVIGANRQPLAGAVVEIRGADTVLIARASSAADGRFTVPALRFGRYRVTARALGYAPLLRSTEISDAARSVDLGDLPLLAAAVELQTLKVVEQQQRALELAPDRNSFRVADLPTTRGGSAIDVLRNIPAVDVDIDNQVALRGDAGVIVQINGRRSPMKPAQLGNYLAQLPASMVDRVEVITNPSARDNAEGSAGIINIVLKRRTTAGSSGGLTLAQGTTRRSEVGGNYGWQGEHLTAYGSYGYLHDRRPRTELLMRDNFATTPLTHLDQRGDRLQIPDSHTGTLALRYAPSKRDEVSFDGAWSERRERSEGLIAYVTTATGRPADLRTRASNQRGEEGNREATFEYRHAFGDEHELSTELRWVEASEGGPTMFSTQTNGANGAPVLARESATGWEYPHERSLRVDYQRPLGELMQWRIGYRGSTQPLHTTLDTRLADASGALVVPDLLRSNDFTYEQGVQAGYVMLTGKPGPVRLQGGVRVEGTNAQFRRATNGAAFDRSYVNAFPSALVAWDVTTNHQVKASWSTRIRRPDDPDQLDPTVHFQDPLNLSRGNPDLRAELVNAYELGYQRTTKHTVLQLTPYVRHTQDAVRRLRQIDTAGVTTSTFANIASVTAWGTDLTLALRGGRVTGFVGGSAYGQQSNASNVSAALSTRATGWTSRANINLRLPARLDAQALVTYRAPVRVEQGTNASQTRVNFAVRRKFPGDRLSLTLRVTDPFATEWEQSTVDDPRFQQFSQRRRQVRGTLLNLTWSFGKPPKGVEASSLLPDDRGL